MILTLLIFLFYFLIVAVEIWIKIKKNQLFQQKQFKLVSLYIDTHVSSTLNICGALFGWCLQFFFFSFAQLPAL